MKQGIEHGTIPFTKDRYGRARKIIFTPDKVAVELVDPLPGVDPDVTSQLTRDESFTVITKISAIRSLCSQLADASSSETSATAATASCEGSRVVVVTEAMVDACYDHPDKVPLPGKTLMRKTLERALQAANVVTVDLPYLHLHARLSGDYLMKAKAHLGHRWTGALDEALNHVDYVKTALDPYVEDKPMESPPDYKKLFEDAMYHLRVLSGSRNSFTSDATDRLFDLDQPRIELRTPEVEKMHREAHQWLTQHEHLIPTEPEPKEED
jgi:hypothetical protein